MADKSQMSRRSLLAAGALAATAGLARQSMLQAEPPPALIAISLDLEMSAEYPMRGQSEWNYRKGDLDDATKQYSLKAGDIVRKAGGKLHYFCVGQSFEQPNIEWLKQLSADGHPIGNHTYDHISLKAGRPIDLQFRFQRAPWLLRGRTIPEVIRDNIQLTTEAMRSRAGIEPAGFRTPGGFHNGLQDREDLQQLLLESGFKWISSHYPAHKSGEPKVPPPDEVFADIVRAQANAQPYIYPTGLIEVPMSPISDVTAFRSNWWKLSDFLRAIRAAVTWAIDQGAVFDFLAHPSCLVVEDPQCETIQMICDLVKDAGPKAKIAGLDELATRASEKK